MLRRGGTAIALALTGALLAVVPVTAAAADPPPDPEVTCPFANAYTWDTNVTDGYWQPSTPSSTTHWTKPAAYTQNFPNDHSPHSPADPEPGPSYACIGPDVTVRVDANHDRVYDVAALWLAPRSTLVIEEGAGVFMDGPETSYAATDSAILVDVASLGGTGTLLTRGLVEVQSSNQFASALRSNWNLDPVTAETGTLHVDAGATLSLPAYGVNFDRGYQILVDGTATLGNNSTADPTDDGFLAVGYDSSLTVGSDGVLDFGGNGGFYEGPPNPNAVTSLVNDSGIIRKSGGGTAVIGSDFQNTGTIEVTGGTLAFAGGTTYSAVVDAGQQLSTEKCADLVANTACVPEDDPTEDAQSVKFTVPTLEPDGVHVQVEEQDVAATSVDPNGVGNVFLAHADAVELDASPGDPAVIEFRLGTNVTGTTNLADLGIVHVPDAGASETLPTCLPSGLPPSGTGCVDRRGLPGSSRVVGDNVYLVVRTTVTSRYVCHKVDALLPPPPPPPPDVTPPTIQSTTALPVALKKPISVTVKVNEPGTLSISGAVVAKGLNLQLTAISARTNANGEATAVLYLKAKQKKKLKKARAQQGKAVLSVAVTDLAGNATRVPVTVPLT